MSPTSAETSLSSRPSKLNIKYQVTYSQRYRRKSPCLWLDLNRDPLAYQTTLSTRHILQSISKGYF